jgi:ribose-phosphate pyrophosphokinase
LIVDDIVATGNTITRAVEALVRAGARPEFTVAATHGLLLSGARDKLKSVRDVFVTDTVRVDEKEWPTLRVVSVAPLIVAALQRLLSDGAPNDVLPQNEPGDSRG